MKASLGGFENKRKKKNEKGKTKKKKKGGKFSFPTLCFQEKYRAKLETASGKIGAWTPPPPRSPFPNPAADAVSLARQVREGEKIENNNKRIIREEPVLKLNFCFEC